MEALESTIQTQRPAGSGFHGGVPLPRDRRGRGRLEGIEGLRALAATAILAFHVWDETAGVQAGASQHLFANLRAGVTLFFVLSGFLLYRPFAAAVVRGEASPSVRRYAVNRALRILPAYWAILLLDALLLDRGLLTRPLQLVANLSFAQNYVPRYQPNGHHYLGIGPAWSVVIELSFYALLPLLGLLAFAAVRRSRRPTAAALTPAAFMLLGGAASLLAYRRGARRAREHLAEVQPAVLRGLVRGRHGPRGRAGAAGRTAGCASRARGLRSRPSPESSSSSGRASSTTPARSCSTSTRRSSRWRSQG